MQRIIFFDGVCNLCDAFVSQVFKIDKNHVFQFSSLQSETAKKLLSPQDLTAETVIYYEDGTTYHYSDAVIKILKQLGGFLGFAAFVYSLFPLNLRHKIYAAVAKNRYRLFGKKTECRLPTADERRYFLP